MSDLPMTREAEVDAELAILREAMLAPGAAVEFTCEAGMEVRDNWVTGLRQYKPNGSRTYTVTINGGAHNTKGEAIR